MRKMKDYILRRLGILQSRDQIANAQNKIEELEQKINTLNREKQAMFQRIYDLEKLLHMHARSLNTRERDPRIIVSLTSFPERINIVSVAIERMLSQTVSPDKIVLWLSKEQFPQMEKDLPEHLLKLKTYGVEIEWCDGDLKAFKKILPALKKYPNDIIITIDDDLIYHTDHIEKLYKAHGEFPNAIIASRVHEIVTDDNGKIAPYTTWKKECSYDICEIREDWFLTSGAGTLFPPNVFGKEIFEDEIIQRLCPWSDDIWINVNAAISHVPIVNIATNNYVRTLPGTQEKCLVKINVDEGKNDKQLRDVVMYYKDKLKNTIYDNI